MKEKNEKIQNHCALSNTLMKQIVKYHEATEDCFIISPYVMEVLGPVLLKVHTLLFVTQLKRGKILRVNALKKDIAYHKFLFVKSLI